MTHTTEQERAEFEAWLEPEYSREKWHTGEYTDDTVFSMFAAWQAARRAPAVLVPQKGWRYVPEVLTPEMKREFMDMLMDGIDIYMNSNDQIEIQTDAPRRIWKSILAAAPQPPEADHFPGVGKMVAAPVELLEPEWWINYCAFTSKETASRIQESELASAPLYTEQQVRQLLAARGIEVAQ